MEFIPPQQERDQEIDAFERRVSDVKQSNIHFYNWLGSLQNVLAMLKSQEIEFEQDYQERKIRLERLKKWEEIAETGRKFTRYLIKFLFEQRLFSPTRYKEKQEKIFEAHLEYLSSVQKKISQRKREHESLPFVKQYRKLQEQERNVLDDLQQLSSKLENEGKIAKTNIRDVKKKINQLILSLVINNKKQVEKADETTRTKNPQEISQRNEVTSTDWQCNSKFSQRFVTQSLGKTANYHIPKICAVRPTSGQCLENSKGSVEAMLSYLKKIVDGTNNSSKNNRGGSPSQENVQIKRCNFSTYTHTGEKGILSEGLRYFEQKSYTVSSSVTVTETRNGVYVESKAPVLNTPLKKVSPKDTKIIEASVRSSHQVIPIQNSRNVEPLPQSSLPKALLSSTTNWQDRPLAVGNVTFTTSNADMIGEMSTKSNAIKSPPGGSHVQANESKKVIVLSNVIIKQTKDEEAKSNSTLLKEVSTPNEGIIGKVDQVQSNNGLKSPPEGISEFVEIPQLESSKNNSHGGTIDKQNLKRVGDKMAPILEVKREKISKSIPSKLSPPPVTEGVKIRPSADTPIELDTELPSTHITIHSSNENCLSNSPINNKPDDPNRTPPLETTFDFLNVSNISNCASPARSDFYKDIFRDMNFSIPSPEPNDKKRKASPSSADGIDFGDFNLGKKRKTGTDSSNENFFQSFAATFSGSDGYDKDVGFKDFAELMGENQT